jgi:hypothetical protein
LEIPESCCVFDADGGAGVSEADLAALAALQGGFSKCVVSHHLVADLLTCVDSLPLYLDQLGLGCIVGVQI